MTRQPTSRVRRRGSVFILTLAILIVLTSLALVLARVMRVEASSAVNYVAQLQAEAVAQGAVAYIKTTLASSEGQMPDDTALLAQAVPVGEGYFWLLKRDHEDSSTHAYGLTDEGGKFNINTIDPETLANLPNMTFEIAGAILDWRDDNEEIEAGGAESAHYLSLPQPYQAKNEAFESIEELLLVKDITPQVLYGEDINRNGVLDPNENDGDESDPPDNRDGVLDHGLIAYVTAYSGQEVLDETGQTRINVNTGTELVNVLSEVLSGSRLGEVTAEVVRNRPFENLIDFYFRSGLQQAEFQQIESRLTVGAEQARGLVNLNTAPRPVLAAMPGLVESDVEMIIARQQSGPKLESLADIIELLPREKAIAIGGMVTTRSHRYSADIVAIDAHGRAFKRWWVVFDAQAQPARVLYVRDLTALGWPLDEQILTDLRAGERLEMNTLTTTSSYGVR